MAGPRFVGLDWWLDLPGNQKVLEALRRSVTRGAPSAKAAGCGGRQARSPGMEPARAPAKEKEGKWREELLTPIFSHQIARMR